MKSRACRSRGLTLVELLVAIVIGLLLVAAAGYLFISTTRASRAIDASAQQQEAASVVLDIIGRDLKNAGFYPASFPVSSESPRFQGAYSNIVSASAHAFDQGIFGCSSGLFNVEKGTCPAAKDGEPDSLVVNYFSADNFETEGVGTRKDCLRQDVELAEFGGTKYNEARAGSGAKARAPSRCRCSSATSMASARATPISRTAGPSRREASAAPATDPTPSLISPSCRASPS